MSNTLDRLELSVLAGMADSPTTTENLAKGFQKFVTLGKNAMLTAIAVTTITMGAMGDAKAFDLGQIVNGMMGGGNNVQYQQPQQYQNNGNGQNETQYTGIAIGGVAGGVIGNQVGKGNGKIAATAFGAVIGALSGEALQKNMQEKSNNTYNNGGVQQPQQYPNNAQVVQYQQPQQYPNNAQVVQYQQPQQYPNNVQVVQYQQPQQYPNNGNGQNETQYTGTVIGGVAGAVLGNQVGKGNGKTAATAFGAVIGALSGEALQKNMQGKSNNNGNPYSNGGVQQVVNHQQNSGGSQFPSNMRDMGLYSGRNVNGGSFVVTLADSPGIMALQGRLVGNKNIESEPIVKESLIINTQNVMNAHQALDQTAQEYIRVMTGGTAQGHLSKYATNIRDQSYNQGYRQELENMKNNYERAFQNFAAQRGQAASVYDMAALDGYSIYQFGNVISSLIPPQSTQAVQRLKDGYSNNYSPNKVAQIETPMVNPAEIARRSGWIRPN